MKKKGPLLTAGSIKPSHSGDWAETSRGQGVRETLQQIMSLNQHLLFIYYCTMLV